MCKPIIGKGNFKNIATWRGKPRSPPPPPPEGPARGGPLLPEVELHLIVKGRSRSFAGQMDMCPPLVVHGSVLNHRGKLRTVSEDALFVLLNRLLGHLVLFPDLG